MPSLIAATVPNVTWLILVWVIGGVIALVGALCFAELTTTYPEKGGDYGYLKRAFHPRVGFAFSWTAFWIVRPANIGAMAMIFGEFAQEALPGLVWFQTDAIRQLFFAILAVVVVSITNLVGVTVGKTTQNILTVAKVAGILLIVAAAFLFRPAQDEASLKWSAGKKQEATAPVSYSTAGLTSEFADAGTFNNASALGSASQLTLAKLIEPALPVQETEASKTDQSATADPDTESPNVESDEEPNWEWFWLAMVFVMFAFGGWNDIAFVASEVQEPKKNLLRSLVIGTLVVLGVYLLVNFALLFGLGYERMVEVGFGGNVTSELVTQNMGQFGNRLLSIVVCVSCLGAINAMIFTSPRIYAATAADYPALSWLVGENKGEGWWRAMLLQTVVTLGLVVAFGRSEKGFENLTVANAPFFWSFLGLTVMAMIVLRFKTKGELSGYRSPLFPVLPILFLTACGFMVYRGWSWMVGQDLQIWTYLMAGVVIIGVVLSCVLNRDYQAD